MKKPKPRGTPRKTLTGVELAWRYRNKGLVRCDETGAIAADQTTPTDYIRAMTKAEKLEAQIEAVAEILGESPDLERCNADGTPNPSGDHWHLREGA